MCAPPCHAGAGSGRARSSSPRYAGRGTATAPRVARCGVTHCTSSSRPSTPSAVISETSATSATFDASRTRWNIDSPANSPPIPTPYSPPASSPSRHASTECAQPSRCSSAYAAAMSRVIHPASRAGSPQRATTSSKAVSTRISKSRHERRSDRDTTSPSSGTIPRCAGREPVHRRPGAVLGHREDPPAVRRQQGPRREVGADADQVVLGLARVREDPRGGWGLDRHLRRIPMWA